MTADVAYREIDDAFSAAETNAALADLTEERRAALHEYWLARADGELTTALAFEFMLDDLVQESVPSSVSELARNAIGEEHRHVDYCLAWARRVDPSRPAEAHFHGTRPHGFDGASDHDNRLLRTVFGGCFSETIAVHVLRASHLRIQVESVRRLNQQHLKEEVLHARLGWALAGWDGLTPRDRSMIATYVPEMARLARDLWLSTSRTGDAILDGLGYLPSDLVRVACDEALDGATFPGLDACGIR